MTLGEIEAFDAVMRTRSTNRAAELLGISQPAVSRAIARLAQSTRLTLFRRVGGRLVATPEAELFHEEVRRSFTGLDRLRSRATSIREFGAGTLRVACYPALGLAFVPKAVKRFRDADPSANVTLSIAGSPAVRDMVASGRVDVALAADEIDTTRVTSQVFMTPSAICVMPKNHRLAARKVIAPADLAGEPYIALSPDDTVQKKIVRAFAEAGVEPRVVVETQYSETVCNLALEGVGVGLANAMSYRASHFDSRGLVARRFAPSISFRALLLFPADRQQSAKATAFVSALFAVRNAFGAG